METATMGRVVVTATMENVVELFLAEKGALSPDQVHRVEVPDALVDTGSTYLSMPRSLITQLGFEKPFAFYRLQTTRGLADVGIYGPVRLTVQDRFCTVDIAEADEGCPVLIGQVPLELLDFVVDPQGARLIGNPRHGGQQMYDMF
jgi:predicted aspartyl protease